MRLKDFTELTPNYNGQPIDGNVSFVPMESLRNGEIDLKEIPFSQAAGKYTFFANGDLLIAKVTPCFENGNIAIANDLLNGVGFGSSEIFVLRVNKKKALNTYMFYVSETEDFQGKACATMHGVGGLKRIDPLFMRTYEFNLPPMEVQQRIVSYLDDKTAKINKAVSLLQKKRDAYTRLKTSIINRAVTRGLNPNVKLKDSGVEWIGMIPEGWEVKAFKRFMNINNGCDYKHIIADEGYPVIGSGGVFEHASQYLYDGEVLLLGRKGTIDKPMYFKDKFWTVDTMFYCIPNKDVSCKYVYYQALIVPLLKYSTQTALPSMTQTSLNNIPYCVPPLSEQRTIANYLDTHCTRIDHAISIVDKQIDAYTRLKKSLINEVVTGKRKV